MTTDKTTQDAPTEIIAYKVFNQDWTCRGFQFEVGKSYHQNGEIVPCDNGFHACVNLADCFGYYSFNPDNKVAKVRLYGTLASKEDKICASDIELLDELSWEKVLRMVNTGKGNSGYRNSGYRNSGDYNSGDYNSGDRNSGDYNSGYRNSGYRNSGYRNSGDYNSGDYNSGDYNSGDYNSGYFNTDTPKTVRVFGAEIDRILWERCPKPNFLYFSPITWVSESEMSDQEKIDNPKFFTAGGYLKEIPYKQAFKESFEKASKEDRKLILGIPNFNKGMFYEISGINIDEYDLS
ncbi:hypothetical protein EKK58_11270 [Candidatus Dependentiae bacterium]|nr:MAG: hypothetical protein EKK58_11270 [Candidatus Dependentiae bacterium]